ncbi:Ribulose-5-phosphate 4-epimerase/Fuculose-1-phosphate aldolase [Lentibacillus halodurans]|uniref:Ribulose-5-phosphate 4-epimerase/Fuculose-1-phosphate aldolase n=1 Tax=Lentibacillus halodurans TaxID=237679 RepID=A0A1I0ZAK9_9BACI|nr:class II aldolase/adducin family protein [Lentibacillus halodurans]SFB22146.1 Ribulose-5-phosphate 4-epimerase/Fuculose-1-phosphate aldolase [Lentibacillus halodurans]
MHQFTITGNTRSSFSTWFVDGLKQKFSTEGYDYCPDPTDNIRVVFNVLDSEKPRPFRRKAQATFVVSIIEADETPKSTFEAAYPYLIRSLSNHLIYILHTQTQTDIYFVTPEQGFYKITYESERDETFFQKIFERLEPVASSQLVIDNHFNDNLQKRLWNGNENTKKMYISGKKLDKMDLLPAPFPLEDYLTSRDMRQLKKLYGIGGLSYGNLSTRENESSFWMSASGVDKANLQVIGKDLLYITDFNAEKNAMEISVPPHTEPKRASVDAIEHWMIYKEHPQVGAIVHIHAWIEGVQATEVNYPCGTIELAETVADLVRSSKDPSRAIIGLKNHGLTITGRDLDDIFERIDGRIQSQVPMSS